MIKTQEDFFNKIFTSHFIAKVRKGCVGFYCERELEIEHDCNILTPLLWPSALCLSCSLMFNRSPGVHSAGCWLSLLYLLSIFSGPQNPSGFPRAPSAGCSFPYHISSYSDWKSNSTASGTRTQLSYIIVQRPLDRLLDFWNRMFNRHQAEITVLQFRGHFLPVHHSVVAQWDLPLVPYYQP